MTSNRQNIMLKRICEKFQNKNYRLNSTFDHKSAHPTPHMPSLPTPPMPSLPTPSTPPPPLPPLSDVSIDRDQKEDFGESLYRLLEGKNILFIDLETTGLPGKPTSNIKCLFEDNLKFNSSRILEIGWYYLTNFRKDFIFDHNDVKQILRKPTDFKHIPHDSFLIHGITYERVSSDGEVISQIMNGEFGECLKGADIVMAYNAVFDVSIVLNELYRIKFDTMYRRLSAQIDANQILCMKKICKEYFGKIARQKDVYHKCFGDYPPDQHRAKGDCIAMVDIFRYIIDNPTGRKVDKL